MAMIWLMRLWTFAVLMKAWACVLDLFSWSFIWSNNSSFSKDFFGVWLGVYDFYLLKEMSMSDSNLRRDGFYCSDWFLIEKLSETSSSMFVFYWEVAFELWRSSSYLLSLESIYSSSFWIFNLICSNCSWRSSSQGRSLLPITGVVFSVFS